MKFRATVELARKTATGIEVPADVVTALGAGKRPPVRVTIGDYTYRNTVAVMGGRFMVSLSADNRTGAGVAAGDVIDVDLALDTEPRVVTVPDDLAAALAAEPGARQRFDALSPSQRGRHVLLVTGAKTSDTRQRRVTRVVADLREP